MRFGADLSRHKEAKGVEGCFDAASNGFGQSQALKIVSTRRSSVFPLVANSLRIESYS
jgi:hypothetical protein